MDFGTVLINRICHDLITPLNAINLGIEAFEVSNDTSLLDCVKHSTDKANCMIKFFRELFSEKANTFCYSKSSLQTDIFEYLKTYNIKFMLSSDIDHIPYQAGKIIMFNAIIVHECLPLGGDAHCYLNNIDGSISVKIVGRSVLTPNIIPNQEITYKNVINISLQNLLKELGFKFISKIEGNTLTISEQLI